MQLHNTILYDIIKNICNQTEADGTVILNQKLPTSSSSGEPPSWDPVGRGGSVMVPSGHSHRGRMMGGHG